MKHILLLSLILGCSAAQGLPKFAEASSVICDSLAAYEHFEDEAEQIKLLVENAKYMEAVLFARETYLLYEQYPETEGLKELRTLVQVLENLL